MKKAQISADVFSWIPKIILMVAVMLAVLFLVRMFVVLAIDIKDAEVTVVMNRILYSPSGFSYKDEELNRVYPGIIDLEKFKKLNPDGKTPLDEILYHPNNRMIAAKLQLRDFENNKVAETFFNKRVYENLFPVTGIRGPSGATIKTKKVYMLYRENDKLKQGVLTIDIISLGKK